MCYLFLLYLLLLLFLYFFLLFFILFFCLTTVQMFEIVVKNFFKQYLNISVSSSLYRVYIRTYYIFLICCITYTLYMYVCVYVCMDVCTYIQCRQIGLKFSSNYFGVFMKLLLLFVIRVAFVDGLSCFLLVAGCLLQL